MKLVKYGFLICFLLTGNWLTAQTEWIDIEIWCELEPAVPAGESEFPVPRQEAFNRLMEEARIIFSYMIYGCSFTYTPSDQIRHVTEAFTINPLFEIRWGDKNLEVLSSRTEKERLYARLRYYLADFQDMRINSWQSNIHPVIKGSGESELYKGYTGKITALQNAVKNSVKEYIRTQVYNKPRQITGEVLLIETPYTIIRAGEYRATAAFKLNIKDIIPYRSF